MTWKPDPSFYPSPRMASKAAQILLQDHQYDADAQRRR